MIFYCENHTKSITIFHGQKAEIIYVKASGTYNYYILKSEHSLPMAWQVQEIRSHEEIWVIK